MYSHLRSPYIKLFLCLQIFNTSGFSRNAYATGTNLRSEMPLVHLWLRAYNDVIMTFVQRLETEHERDRSFNMKLKNS
jgi:hypothetical protein